MTFEAAGERVHVRIARYDDLAAYRQAVTVSLPRLRRWNPADPEDLAAHISAQSMLHRTFLVLANDPAGSHGVVGKVNVTNIVHGRLLSATLGYDAFDPYAGQGLFTEGLALVVGVALAPQPAGLGLHRVEADVQPGNVLSARALRSLGFRREGHHPRFLHLSDEHGRVAWRDHDAYAVLSSQWPPPRYAVWSPQRVVAWVSLPEPDLAATIATELGLPLLPVDRFGRDVVGEVVAASPAGAVVLDPEADAGWAAAALTGRAVGAGGEGPDGAGQPVGGAGIAGTATRGAMPVPAGGLVEVRTWERDGAVDRPWPVVAGVVPGMSHGDRVALALRCRAVALGH